MINVTNMQSPNRRREFIGGLIEGGEITVELNFAPNDSTHQLLVAEQTAGTPSEHKVTFPDGVTLTVEAIVTSVSWNAPVDDKMSLSFTRSEEHTSEPQSRGHLVCRLLLEKKNIQMAALDVKQQ